MDVRGLLGPKDGDAQGLNVVQRSDGSKRHSCSAALAGTAIPAAASEIRVSLSWFPCLRPIATKGLRLSACVGPGRSSPCSAAHALGLRPSRAQGKQWQQDRLGFREWELLRLPRHVGRNPGGERHAARSMRATRSVLIPHLRKVCSRKPGRELDQRWPEAAVDERDLPLHQLADQDVGAFADRLRRAVDLPTLRVAPPAASNPLTRNRVGETRHTAPSALQYDPMLFHEGQCLLRTHRVPPVLLTRCPRVPAAAGRWAGLHSGAFP
jgi:hypothetical protein